MLQETGRYADARDLHQDILDRSRRISGDGHIHTLTCANNLAVGLHAWGRCGPPGHLGADPRLLGRSMINPETVAAVTPGNRAAVIS